MSDAEFRGKIATACRILHNEGLADYQGHVSARTADGTGLLIKPRFVGLGEVQAGDIISVSLEGQVVEASRPPPYESPMHTQVYKARSDVQSVVHTHSKFATAFAIAKRPLLPIHQLGLALGRSIPIHDYWGMIDTAELGDAMARSLGTAVALLLPNHGVVTVGGSVEEATVRAIWLEQVAEWQVLADRLGGARAIPPSPMADTHAAHQRESTVPAAWKYYSDRLRD